MCYTVTLLQAIDSFVNLKEQIRNYLNLETSAYKHHHDWRTIATEGLCLSELLFFPFFYAGKVLFVCLVAAAATKRSRHSGFG